MTNCILPFKAPLVQNRRFLFPYILHVGLIVEEKMGKHKYAVYVRVSTDKDEQISSVENQIDICRNWLERNGFEWDEKCIFKDQGISGTVFLERPAIQLILEKAKQKEIEMVVFKSISRRARDALQPGLLFLCDLSYLCKQSIRLLHSQVFPHNALIPILIFTNICIFVSKCY